MYNYYLDLITEAETISQCEELEYMINTDPYIWDEVWDDLMYAIDDRKNEIYEEKGGCII